jgi:hypothetical protein
MATDLESHIQFIAGLRLTPAAIDLVKTLVAPAAALVGVWVGAIWNTRTEGRRWQRDQRVGAYSAFLHEVVTLRLFIVMHSREQLDEKSSDPQLMIDQFRPMVTSGEALHFYGNDRVTSASQSVIKALQGLTAVKEEERDTAEDGVARAIRDYVAACREELGIR